MILDLQTLHNQILEKKLFKYNFCQEKIYKPSNKRKTVGKKFLPLNLSVSLSRTKRMFETLKRKIVIFL